MMDRPDCVRRVTAPKRAITNIMAQHNKSQYVTLLSILFTLSIIQFPIAKYIFTTNLEEPQALRSLNDNKYINGSYNLDKHHASLYGE
jgi:hypothetical protein